MDNPDQVRGTPDILEQDLIVPFTDDNFAAVWGVNSDLTYISNVVEEVAQMNAPGYPDTIFFYADLAPAAD